MDKLLACAKTLEELLDSDYLTFRYRPQKEIVCPSPAMTVMPIYPRAI
ncbi:MAG: hypothetical protein IJT42_05020 [Treponema sp.]|nr:hypothetical protein [Treponema sp.]